jgi:hypothetical protein
MAGRAVSSFVAVFCLRWTGVYYLKPVATLHGAWVFDEGCEAMSLMPCYRCPERVCWLTDLAPSIVSGVTLT